MRRSEKSQRSLPSELRSAAASRTSSAVETLRSCMEEWERELKASGFKLEHAITLKDLTSRAGLNPKFLYGRLHKDTTRVEAERWTERMNAARAQQLQATAAASPPEHIRSDAAYWEQRYRKVARHANRWLLELRDLQRANRDLLKRLKADATVVPMTRKGRSSDGGGSSAST